MAAANIVVNSMWATIECDDTEHKIDVGGIGGALVNVGAQSVFLSMETSGDLKRDGLQHDGELKLEPGDTVPLPAEGIKIRQQCAAGQNTTLWYCPKAG